MNEKALSNELSLAPNFLQGFTSAASVRTSGMALSIYSSALSDLCQHSEANHCVSPRLCTKQITINLLQHGLTCPLLINKYK